MGGRGRSGGPSRPPIPISPRASLWREQAGAPARPVPACVREFSVSRGWRAGSARTSARPASPRLTTAGPAVVALVAGGRGAARLPPTAAVDQGESGRAQRRHCRLPWTIATTGRRRHRPSRPRQRPVAQAARATAAAARRVAVRGWCTSALYSPTSSTASPLRLPRQALSSPARSPPDAGTRTPTALSARNATARAQRTQRASGAQPQAASVRGPPACDVARSLTEGARAAAHECADRTGFTGSDSHSTDDSSDSCSLCSVSTTDASGAS